MTYKEREEIFSKEVLTIKDFELLFDVGYSQAAKMLSDTKRKLLMSNMGLRLAVEGRIHTQDYLDCYKIKGGNLRYCAVPSIKTKENKKHE